MNLLLLLQCPIIKAYVSLQIALILLCCWLLRAFCDFVSKYVARGLENIPAWWALACGSLVC